MANNLFRNIPSVNELLEQTQLQSLVDKVSHNVVVDQVRSVLDELRQEVQEVSSEWRFPNMTEIAERIAKRIREQERSSLRPVINATGILLHTGLGRAPLAEAAVEELLKVGRDYASVEVDLQSGERSQRVWAVEGLLKQITGAEAAAVVNNNAGATMIVLAALAAGREVIVSRGQLIEIGGSFRLPDVMSTSGAHLREVGTTNKTKVRDYRDAIGEETAAMMLVHPSNYKVVGFTETPSLDELVELGREKSIPVIDDIGSGALLDFAEYGFADEPVAKTSIEKGADVVLFSGDKLLGGPQCGIIVGKRKFVDKIAGHPMMRALRVDKLTLAALSATLRLYRDDKKARQEIPLLQMLSTSMENLRNRAERLAPQIADCPTVKSAEAVEDVCYLGGGSIPTQELPTWCIAVTPAAESVDHLARRLRTGDPAVVGRVQKDRLLLDLRSIFPRQDQPLVDAFRHLSQPAEQPESAEAPPEPPEQKVQIEVRSKEEGTDNR